eukprot:g29325.t1
MGRGRLLITCCTKIDNMEKTRDEIQISRGQEEIQVHETNARESFCSEDQQVSTPSNKSVVSEHGQRQTSLCHHLLYQNWYLLRPNVYLRLQQLPMVRHHYHCSQ